MAEPPPKCIAEKKTDVVGDIIVDWLGRRAHLLPIDMNRIASEADDDRPAIRRRGIAASATSRGDNVGCRDSQNRWRGEPSKSSFSRLRPSLSVASSEIFSKHREMHYACFEKAIRLSMRCPHKRRQLDGEAGARVDYRRLNHSYNHR